MPRYVAFLRAINVGGHTLKMERLRALLEELPLENVSTFIASGNVLFDAVEGDVGALERRIDRHLERALGYEVGTFIRTPEELAGVSRHPPFQPDELERGGTLYVSFLSSPPPDGTAERVAALSTAVDDLRLHGRELYWLCAVGIGRTEVKGPQLGRVLGRPSTMRNINTVRRILAKVAG
ncbi:MAG TPA: DUF1697 domain-containing protein [Longimicrobiaceae bacterium]